MTKTLRHFIFIFSALAFGSAALAEPDPRQAPITRDALISGIRREPLNSGRHYDLIIRARNSGLLADAETELAALVREHPMSAQANYLAGACSIIMDLAIAQGVKLPPSPLPHAGYIGNARTYLKRALDLDGKLADACTLYGYVLWQEDHKFDEGLALLRKGVRMAPNEARAHYWLALVLGNPTGPSYDAMGAYREMQIAARLDSRYIPPRVFLALLCRRLGRNAEAAAHERAWRSLLPPGVDASRVSKVY